MLGNTPWAELIADCTSCAAPSMPRVRSNCRVTWLTPADELLCIVVRPLIWPIWRSIGAVTSVDIVSAPAPG